MHHRSCVLLFEIGWNCDQLDTWSLCTILHTDLCTANSSGCLCDRSRQIHSPSQHSSYTRGNISYFIVLLYICRFSDVGDLWIPEQRSRSLMCLCVLGVFGHLDMFCSLDLHPTANARSCSSSRHHASCHECTPHILRFY